MDNFMILNSSSFLCFSPKTLLPLTNGISDHSTSVPPLEETETETSPEVTLIDRKHLKASEPEDEGGFENKAFTSRDTRL